MPILLKLYKIVIIISFPLCVVVIFCYSGTIMATGANTAPLGRLHPILAGKGGSNLTTPTSTPLGSKQAMNKNPELRAHLEAAKRAASALFSGKF